MRNLHGYFVRSVVDIDLEIAIARHFNLELGEVMVGIAQIIIHVERSKFVSFVNRLVRNLLEHRRVIHGLHVKSDFLLGGTAFRVHHRERSDCVTKPARVRDFNRCDMLIVNRNVKRSRFRHRTLVLDFDIPRKFGILVVFVLDKVIELNLSELLLFVDVLSRNRANELRQVIHGVDRKHGFAFGTCTFGVAGFKLDRFGTIPHFVRNADCSHTARNRDLQVLGTGNRPLEHFDAVIRVLHILAQLNRGKFLLFVNRLVRNILDKLRRIVDGIYFEQNVLFGGRTSSVGHRKRYAFLTAPIFVREIDNSRTVLVDFNLQVLVARHSPLELHDVIIGVSNIIRKGQHVELIPFVDNLVRNLLRECRRVVNRRNRKGCSLVVATVVRVRCNKLDGRRTVPMGIRNYNRCHAVPVNIHRQVAIALRTARRTDFSIPCNLVLLMVGVINKVVQADFCKLLAFFNNLTRDLCHNRRIVHGFHSEVHRLGSRGSPRVRCRKCNVFGAVPKRARSCNYNRMVRTNNHLEVFVTAHLPTNLRGLVRIIRYKIIKLDRCKSATFLNVFTWDTANLRRVVRHSSRCLGCGLRFGICRGCRRCLSWSRSLGLGRSGSLSWGRWCWILRKRCCCNYTSSNKHGRHGPFQFIHFCSPNDHTRIQNFRAKFFRRFKNICKYNVFKKKQTP